MALHLVVQLHLESELFFSGALAARGWPGLWQVLAGGQKCGSKY